jgi:ankyrin repeat protein
MGFRIGSGQEHPEARSQYPPGDGRFTPLMYAATRNYGLDSIELLLQAGAKLEARDNNGYTPLMLAAERDHVDIVKALLRAKADVTATCNEGKTALMIATKMGAVESVKILKEAGAK